MNKHFPPEMIQIAKLGKMSFLSDCQPINPNDCINCGGMGVFVLFIATEGPYRQPANPYRKDEKTSKWYNGNWWVGESHSFVCPDCKGQGGRIIKADEYKPAELIETDWMEK